VSKTNPQITNQCRIELIYQAVIMLEAQTWENRCQQDSFNAAIKLLEAVEETINQKYPEPQRSDSNAG